MTGAGTLRNLYVTLDHALDRGLPVLLNLQEAIDQAKNRNHLWTDPTNRLTDGLVVGEKRRSSPD
jgi:hypothetical protein